MNYPRFEDAINALNPNATFSAKSIDSIEWLGETTAISQVDIQAKLDELLSAYSTEAYARSRKAKYNALNQLELISDDAINGTTTHADAITAIKAEFPKPV